MKTYVITDHHLIRYNIMETNSLLHAMGLCICVNYLMPPGLPSRMNRWHLSILVASLHCSMTPINGNYSHVQYFAGGTHSTKVIM